MRKFFYSAFALILAAMLTAPAAWAQTFAPINSAYAPTGTHYQVGGATCRVEGLTVICPSYELAGVGNTNATATLSTIYSATVQCRNRGGQIVEVKSTVQSVPSTTGQLEPKNGRLTVPTLTSAPVPTSAQFEALATCPNGNWTKETQTSTIQLVNYTYTLTFAGFTQPAIVISGP